jgi:integrase
VIFSALKWAHTFVGDCSVFNHSIINLMVGGFQRQVANPVRKKLPLSQKLLEKIVINNTQDNASLNHLRSALFCLLGYVGLFRCNELLSIKVQDIHVHPNLKYMCIVVPKAKNDQLRVGNRVYVAASFNKLCPITLLLRFLASAGIGPKESNLFQQLKFLPKSNSYQPTGKPLSYNLARKIVISCVSQAGEDPKNYGTHSLRSGGATAAAAAGINERVLQGHGRWKCPSSKDGYVEEAMENLLLPSRSILAGSQ